VKDDLQFVRLLDLYSPLLTKTQQEITHLYFNCDLSLGEIAEQKGVSRQSVSNWRDNGYLVQAFNNRIKVKETLELWEYLISESKEMQISVHGYGAADLDKI